MTFPAYNLINNDPVPSNCDHRDTGTTRTDIDGGYVATCDSCGTHLTVVEHGSA